MKIRSLGPKDLEKKLDQTIISMGLKSRVTLLPAANENVIRKEQSQAAINLIPSSLNNTDKALMSTLPGKLFELLKVNRPILAIIPSDTEMGSILKKTNMGIATISVDDMLAFFEGGHKCYFGNENIASYSRHNQAGRLCSFLDAII